MLTGLGAGGQTVGQPDSVCPASQEDNNNNNNNNNNNISYYYGNYQMSVRHIFSFSQHTMEQADALSSFIIFLSEGLLFLLSFPSL